MCGCMLAVSVSAFNTARDRDSALLGRFFCQAADFMGSASASEAFGEPGSKVAALPLFLSGLSLAVPWAVLDHAGTECIISVCLLNDSGTEKETETKSGVLAQKEL